MFNPNLHGQSHGLYLLGENVDHFEQEQFNAAVPGQRSEHLYAQAQDLIQRMKSHPELVKKSGKNCKITLKIID